MMFRARPYHLGVAPVAAGCSIVLFGGVAAAVWSQQSTSSLTAPTDTLTQPTVTAATGITATGANANWTAPTTWQAGATYTAMAAASGHTTRTCSAAASAGTCSLTGLDTGVTYSITVVGTYFAWTSATSSAVSATTASVLTPSKPALLAADDTGQSNSDGITKVATPTFTGTGGTAGNTIKLFFDGSATANGQGTIAANGTWSVTAAAALSGSGSTGTSHSVQAQEVAGATVSSLSATTNFRVDTTVPTANGENASNKNLQTAGKAEPGDKITLQYSEAMSPGSILSGWDGTNTNIVVHGNNVALRDTVTFFSSNNSAQLPLGTLQLGGTDYFTGDVTFGLAGSGTLSTMTMDSTGLITITLGTVSDGTKTTTSGTNDKGALTWTPSASATDVAGNACSTSFNSNGLNTNYF
jgi:hypothetical protein